MKPYEEQVIREIAQHLVEPSPVTKLLAKAGKSVESVLQAAESVPVLKRIPDIVHDGIRKSMDKLISVANKTCSDESILKEYRAASIPSYEAVIECDLELKDHVADRFDVSNAIIVGTEGALLGLAVTLCEGLPFAQVAVPAVIASDVAASMTLLSRHVCQIATSYGYSSQRVENIPHVLAAMAPQTTVSEEGYLSAKFMVQEACREAGRFTAKAVGRNLGSMLSKGETPAVVRLIEYIAGRLGVTFTQKELGILVPIAGAALNGGINVAFQQTGHIYAKDYFRTLHLERLYGSEAVTKAISEEIERLKSASSD
jgi:hypothetical protein